LLLDTLERELPAPGAARVGVTGAPGSGKSTLLDRLVVALRQRGESIGVIAVDPSSPRSGGALLGDRFRLRNGARDAGVFIRSMAARNRLGGLSDAARASVLVLAAAFDHVFVETVGVGQSEADVAQLADTLLFVAQPGAGDTLQFMKAGVLELPDLFAVNKADLGEAARRTAGELEAGLGLSAPAPFANGWTPPVVLVSAREGHGIDKLCAALDAHRAHLLESGELAARRRRGRTAFIVDNLRQRYGSFGLERLGGAAEVEKRNATGRDITTFGLLSELSREIEEHLCPRENKATRS